MNVCVIFISDNTDIVSTNLTLPNDNTGVVLQDMPWQKKLEYAQNVIFCKEVFQQVGLFFDFYSCVKYCQSQPYIANHSLIYLIY